MRFRPNIIKDGGVLCPGFMVVLTLNGGHVQKILYECNVC